MARFRRKILLIGAFHRERTELYQQIHVRETRRWARLTGCPIRFTIAGSNHWNVEDLDAQVETNVEVLGWDSLLPAQRSIRPFDRLGQMFRAVAGFVGKRDGKIGARLSWRPLATLLAIPLLFVLTPLLSLLLLYGLLQFIVPGWVAFLAALAGGVLLTTRLIADVGFGPMHFLIFADRLARGEVRDYHRCVDNMTARVETALAEPWDEVLLVAHTHGTLFAMPVMRRLLRRRYGTMPSKFSLLTMGNCIPLLMQRRDAQDFGYDVAEAMGGRFQWVDIGSPRDWTSFFEVGSDRLSRGIPNKVQHESLSARVHLYFNRARLRRDVASIYSFPFNYLVTGRAISPVSFPALSVSDRPLAWTVKQFQANKA